MHDRNSDTWMSPLAVPGHTHGSGRREHDDVTPDPVNSAFVMTVQLMQAGRASLLLRRNGEPILTIAASVGITPSLVPSIEVPVGQGIAGIVAERGMVLLGSVADQTFVSMPVVTERGVEGVLNLTERFGEGRSHRMTWHRARLWPRISPSFWSTDGGPRWMWCPACRTGALSKKCSTVS